MRLGLLAPHLIPPQVHAALCMVSHVIHLYCQDVFIAARLETSCKLERLSPGHSAGNVPRKLPAPPLPLAPTPLAMQLRNATINNTTSPRDELSERCNACVML